jgi:hypothetical protein
MSLAVSSLVLALDRLENPHGGRKTLPRLRLLLTRDTSVGLFRAYLSAWKTAGKEKRAAACLVLLLLPSQPSALYPLYSSIQRHPSKLQPHRKRQSSKSPSTNSSGGHRQTPARLCLCDRPGTSRPRVSLDIVWRAGGGRGSGRTETYFEATSTTNLFRRRIRPGVGL